MYKRTHQSLTLASNYNRKSSAKDKTKISIEKGEVNCPSINSINKDTKIKEPTDEECSDEFSLIKSLWDDLGVRDKYRKAFESTIKLYEKTIRSELINIERETLRKVKDSLTVCMIY